MRKYELTNQTKVTEGRTMHRIRALHDFGTVKAGDVGGWVEAERNLSHDGDCWIFNNGIAMGSGVVSGYGAVRCDQVLTRSAVFIGGLLWPVTIGDNFINVGCVSLNHDELLNMTDEKLPDKDGALDFWYQYGKILKSIVKEYRGER